MKVPVHEGKGSGGIASCFHNLLLGEWGECLCYTLYPTRSLGSKWSGSDMVLSRIQNHCSCLISNSNSSDDQSIAPVTVLTELFLSGLALSIDVWTEAVALVFACKLGLQLTWLLQIEHSACCHHKKVQENILCLHKWHLCKLISVACNVLFLCDLFFF